MTNSYTLDVLRAEMDRKYAPIEIDLGKGEPIKLNNLLRLDSKRRQEVVAAMDDIQKSANTESDQDEEVDTLDLIKRVLTLVCDGNKGKALTDAIGDDLALAMHILTLWTEATQPGEAQNSPA